MPPCLVKIDPPGKYDVQRLIIAAEDMLDICLKIHKNVVKVWKKKLKNFTTTLLDL